MAKIRSKRARYIKPALGNFYKFPDLVITLALGASVCVLYVFDWFLFAFNSVV